jgi:hypothetical protein
MTSEHCMSGLRSVEQLMPGLHRLFHAVLGRLDSCFSLEQTGGGMLCPDLVHIAAMALEAQYVPQVLVGVLTAFLCVLCECECGCECRCRCTRRTDPREFECIEKCNLRQVSSLVCMSCRP